MKKVIFCALLALGVVACGSTDGKPGDGDGGGDGFNSPKDITNRKGCKGTPEPGSTLFATWNQTLVMRETYFFYRYEFTSSSLRFTNTCTFKDGRTLTANVIVPITVDGNHMRILAGRKDGTAECFADIPQRELDYSLVGQCLALQIDGKTHFLVK